MPFFKRAKLEEGTERSSTLVPLLVLIGICFLIVFNLIAHLPMFVQSLLIPVQHPLIYKFPEYDQLLHQVVKGDFVDYQLLKKSKLLDDSVTQLSRVSPDDLEDDQQRFCFWINSYNLLVLKAITEKYPVERLDDRHLSHMDFNKYFIGGRPFSLKEIREQRLVPRFKQMPTALFLACNGCLGSPPLLDHAIEPKTMNKDAEDAAHKFVADIKNVIYDPDHKTFVLTPFFKWNEALFDQLGGPHEFANKYQPAKQQLDLNSRDVLFKSYAKRFNWYLNDTALQNKPQQKTDEPETKTN